MKRHEQLLLENKAWAHEQLVDDPAFFEKLSDGQAPDFLWIGCSDSRVSPSEITHAQPGEMFIHRNIANLVVSTDLNLLSVLQYAVEVLKIKHIVVCGHYGCGGVKAALSNQSLGLIDQWIRYIKDVYRLHKEEVDAKPSEEARVNCLVECNVKEQLTNLANTTFVQDAWKRGQFLALHGWVFGLNDGIIKPVLEIPSQAVLQSVA